MKNLILIIFCLPFIILSQGANNYGEIKETPIAIKGDLCHINGFLLNNDSSLVIIEMTASSRLAKRSHFAIFNLNTLQFLGEFRSEKWAYLNHSYFYKDSLFYLSNKRKNIVFNLTTDSLEKRVNKKNSPKGKEFSNGPFWSNMAPDKLTFNKGKEFFTFKLYYHKLFWSVDSIEQVDTKFYSVGHVVADLVAETSTKMPNFMLGNDSLYSCIKKNMKYPKWEQENHISGTVYVLCIFEIDGTKSSIGIAKSVYGSQDLDREALRIVNKLEGWNPAVRAGKPIKTECCIPITFPRTYK